MKSSFGYLLVASALVASPAIALAEDGAEPAVTAAPEAPAAASAPEPRIGVTAPAPAGVPTPADGAPAPPPAVPRTPDSSTPPAGDPDAIVTLGDGRAPRALRDGDLLPTTPPGRPGTPDLQATESSLIAPSLLDIQAVPNFFVEDFDIPPFLLPIYQAAGSEYGIRWEVLAAINRIETAFGTNLNVSSAGALGWMQFMPATWAQYGVDANDDGTKDPFNPADAIFAAARYLKAAGGDRDLRKAVFAYNHADWYVDMVLEGATRIAAIPEPVVTSLAALTQGTFPVDAPDEAVDYRGKLDVGSAWRGAANAGDERTARADETTGTGARTVRGDTSADSIRIGAPDSARVIAAQDGVVEAVGQSARLGTYVRVRDTAGNRYTYAQLGDLATQVAVPRGTVEARRSSTKHGGRAEHTHTEDEPAATTPKASKAAVPPTAPAATTPAATTPAATTPAPTTPRRARRAAAASSNAPAATTPKRKRGPRPKVEPTAQTASAPTATHLATPEYARRDLTQPDPVVTNEVTDASAPAGVAPTGPLSAYFSIDYGLGPEDVRLVPLRRGVKILAGTVLGQVAPTAAATTPGLRFEIRPTGETAPRIDPRPILDGWRLMDRTAFYRAHQREELADGTEPAAAQESSAGQVLLMSKVELQRRVLADRRITIYGCGRADIKSGAIDRRILALLEFLASKGVRPTVTSLQCGHGRHTASGNVSEHSTGSAVDIGSVYGSVISSATQGVGSPTDRAVREILSLQGAMRPHQIITLMKYPDAPNTLAMADHDDHIHVGYHPDGATPGSAAAPSTFDPKQWDDLVDHLRDVKSPTVAAGPSRYATPTGTTPKAAAAPKPAAATPAATTPKP